MKKYYYRFTKDTLRDGRPIPPIGKWLAHKGPLVPCESGLHASEHPFDALTFAPGNRLHLVELDGEILPHGETKVVSRWRKIVKSIDAEPLLRKFARRVALDVIHLWPKAPDVVIAYLKTGDESLRKVASAAAASARWKRSAERSAWSAGAVEAASARSSARSSAVAVAAAAAWSAASAAWSAADANAANAAKAEKEKTELYRKWFLEEVENAFSKI